MRDDALQQFNELFGPEFGHGKALGLERLREALKALGSPQDHLPPTLHIAGTNGKGSTLAFMGAIAQAAGLVVHAFTKPHLFLVRERFLIANALADDADLIKAAKQVAKATSALTHFDAQVASAFILFSQTPADVVLLETGMGGRDDSTNVIASPALTLISAIGHDHQDALGGSIEAIAAHKAGIIKSGVPCIVGRQTYEVASRVIEAQAEAVGAPLFRHGVEWDVYASGGRLVVQTQTRVLDLPLPALHGAHQIENAGLACAALLTWREFSDDAFAAGLAKARWPGRLQPLTRGPLSARVRTLGGEMWVDGAHNPEAAAALSKALAKMRAERGGENIAIVGLRERKDASRFVHEIARGVDRVIAIPLAEPHYDPGALSKLAEAEGVKAQTAASLAEAVEAAASARQPRVLICGSFLLAAEALALEEA